MWNKINEFLGNSPHFYFNIVTEFRTDLFLEMIHKPYLWLLLLLAIYYSILAVLCYVFSFKQVGRTIVIIMFKFLQWKSFCIACFKHSFIETLKNLSLKSLNLTDSVFTILVYILLWCPCNNVSFSIKVILCFQNSLALLFLMFHAVPQTTSSVCSR